MDKSSVISLGSTAAAPLELSAVSGTSAEVSSAVRLLFSSLAFWRLSSICRFFDGNTFLEVYALLHYIIVLWVLICRSSQHTLCRQVLIPSLCRASTIWVQVKPPDSSCRMRSLAYSESCGRRTIEEALVSISEPVLVSAQISYVRTCIYVYYVQLSCT